MTTTSGVARLDGRMSMRDQVVGLLHAERKPVPVRELVKRLRLSGEQRKELKSVLRKLIADGDAVNVRGARVGLPDRMNLVVGRLTCSPSGYGFVAQQREGQKDVYVSAVNMKEALQGDLPARRQAGGRRDDARLRGSVRDPHARLSSQTGSHTAGVSRAGANGNAVPGETRIERRLDSAVDRATTPRGAAVIIAATTIAITFGSGFLMTVLDHENYKTIGEGLWWAVQTVTTVGYGDSVPTTTAGRWLAAAVMLFGIGFLTVITAAITSTFVARSQLEQKKPELRQRSGSTAWTTGSSGSKPRSNERCSRRRYAQTAQAVTFAPTSFFNALIRI